MIDETAIRRRIAWLLEVDQALVDAADDHGLAWALIGAELVAELRRHRVRSLAVTAIDAPADAALDRVVRAAHEVLGDASFTASDLVAAGGVGSSHRAELRLATCVLVGAAPGEDPSAQAVGQRLAAATKAGPRVVGDLALERLRDHRSGAARWRVAEAADA